MIMGVKLWFVLWLHLFMLMQGTLCLSELEGKVKALKVCPNISCCNAKPKQKQSPNNMDITTLLGRLCFCDEKCHSYHDCCPDIVTNEEIYNKTSVPLWDCSSPQEGSDNPQTFYMVRSCPVQSKFSKLCSLENISEDKYDYKLDIPVLSNKTGVWYQNIFCAICHNMQDYLAPLKLNFNCSSETSVHEVISHGYYQPHKLTWKLNQNNKSSRCTLYVTLADGQDVRNYTRPCVHHEHRCAANWTDTATKNLCHSYSYLVYKLENKMRWYYKNPHCALCNYVEPKKMKCQLGTTQRSGVPSLSLVLELDWKLDSETLQQASCQLPYGIYDPLHEKCVPVENACNDGFVFENGACVPDLEHQRRITRSNSNQSSILDAACFVIMLSPGEFITVNDSIQVTLNTSVAVIPNGMYEILNNGYAKVCNIFDVHLSHDIFKGYVSIVCLSLSAICLLLHNAVYCLLPKMRNLPATNLFSLTSSLFLAQLIFLLGIYPVTYVSHEICVTIAILIHYFFLSSFFWMNAMSLDIWKTFGAKGYSYGSKGRHWKYAVYAWGTPFIITALAVAFDNSNILPLNLRPNYAIHKMICWFGSPTGLLIYFIGPIFCIVLINIVLFGVTIYRLHEIKVSVQFIKTKIKNEHSQSPRKYETESKQHKKTVQPSGGISGNRDKIRFYLYVKLFIIMGLTWISGLIAIFAKVEPLWYIFVVLNGLQGTFIFFMFDFKQNIGSMLWERLFSQHFKQPNILNQFTVSNGQGFKTRFAVSSRTKSSSVSSGQSFTSEKIVDNIQINKKSLEPEEVPLRKVPAIEEYSSVNQVSNLVTIEGQRQQEKCSSNGN